jgi:hypothetical protein
MPCIVAMIIFLSLKKSNQLPHAKNIPEITGSALPGFATEITGDHDASCRRNEKTARSEVT